MKNIKERVNAAAVLFLERKGYAIIASHAGVTTTPEDLSEAAFADTLPVAEAHVSELGHSRHRTVDVD